MYKKKWFYLLIIVELVICYMYIFEASTIYNHIIKNINVTNKILNNKSGFILEKRISSYLEQDETKIHKDKDVLYEKVSENGNFEIGSYGITLEPSQTFVNAEIIKNIYPEEMQRDIESSPENSIPILNIDNNLSNLVEFNIKEGRKLEDSDFKCNGIIPILAGDSYRKKFSIGDEIKIDDNKIYKISGFIERGSKFLYKSKYMFEEIVGLDGVLVVPNNDENIKKYSFESMLLSNVLIFKNIKCEDDEEYMSNVLNELNLKFNVKTFKCKELNYIDRIGHGAKKQLIEAAILIIFAMFSIITVIMYYISSRKREFGIRIASGYSKFDIFMLIFKELGSIVLISYMFTIVYYKAFPKWKFGNYIQIKTGTVQIIILASISFIILLVMILIMVYKLTQLKPHKLIGGGQ